MGILIAWNIVGGFGKNQPPIIVGHWTQISMFSFLFIKLLSHNHVGEVTTDGAKIIGK